MLEEVSVDDSTVFSRPAGAGDGAQGGGRDPPRDRRALQISPSCISEVGGAQAADWLAVSRPDRRIQAANAFKVTAPSGCRERIGSGPFTLRGLAAELAERGNQDASAGGVGVRSRRGPELQKKLCCPRNRRGPDVARRRARWKAYQGRIAVSRLVFIDETWVKTNMAPLRGWGPCGQRLKAYAPSVTGRP